jgi:hypothetical protein
MRVVIYMGPKGFNYSSVRCFNLNTYVLTQVIKGQPYTSNKCKRVHCHLGCDAV